MTPPVVLTIAAHDPLGGAGIAADLTTFAALGVHGMVAVTAVSAQRFDAVEQVVATPADLLARQLDGVIASATVAAVKVGLLFDPAQVEVVVERVADGRLPAPVVDPVMVDGRGTRFVATEIEAAARAQLFPLTAVLTPNRAEATLLGGSSTELAGLGAGLVVVTGGGARATDLLVWSDGSTEELTGEWVDTVNVRGSGCTFAAAVAAGLARGADRAVAVRAAKDFVTARLRDSANWRVGPVGTVGPVAHRLIDAAEPSRQGT
ncbi:MAG: hydroxymethylpyrimidine/phosphomethylpyrimidine kinase [Acidimicrobiales bacterium]